MPEAARQPTTRAPWPTAIAAVSLLFALQAGGDALRHLLRYQRDAVFQGELWRLFTAHLVHLGWTHGLLNACGLLLCCGLAPARFTPRRLAADVLLLGAGVSLLLLAFSPHVAHYVGLSGVLYGLFVLGLAPDAARGDRIARLALSAMAGWMAWQLLVGTSAAEERQIGGRVVAVAHLYGMAVAAAMLLAARWRPRPRRAG